MDQVTRAGRCTSNFPSKPHASRSMKRRMRMRVCCSGTDCRSQTTRRSESTMSDEDTECNVHPGEGSHAFCDCRHKGDHPVNGGHARTRTAALGWGTGWRTTSPPFMAMSWTRRTSTTSSVRSSIPASTTERSTLREQEQAYAEGDSSGAGWLDESPSGEQDQQEHLRIHDGEAG